MIHSSVKLPQITRDGLIVRIMDVSEGLGWSKDVAESAVDHYVNFMTMIKRFPRSSFVPSIAIDEVWHYHILDTKDYQNWCQNEFGKFIHHDPNFGRGDKKIKSRLKRAFVRTKNVYEKCFEHGLEQGLPATVSFCSSTMCSST